MAIDEEPKLRSSSARPNTTPTSNRLTTVLLGLLPLLLLQSALFFCYEAKTSNVTAIQPSGEWYQDWRAIQTTGYEPSPIIAPEERYAVCTIPKNGCTQQKMMMKRMLGDPKWADFRHVHQDPRVDKLTRFSDVPDPTVIALIKNTTIPKFVIVRNPILRTLSAYVDKRGRPFLSHTQQKKVERFTSFVSISFGPYQVDPARNSEDPSVYCEAYKSMDQHWRPQICFCGFAVLPNLFQQFKFENPTPMIDLIEKVVPPPMFQTGWGSQQNVDFRQNYDTSNMNKTHSRGADEMFLAYYTLPTFDIVANRLKKEIQLFGYQDEVAQLRQELVNAGRKA